MLLRQTMLYLPAQVLGPFFQLISAFAWTHVLAPAEMGAFALVGAGQELAFAATLMWFSLYTVRYLDTASDAGGKASFLATESAVLIGSSVAMSLAIAFVPLGPTGRAAEGLLAAAVAFTVTRSIVAHLADRVRAQGDTLAYTVLQTSGPAGGFFVALALTAVLPATAATVLGGYALAQAGSLVFAAWRLEFSSRPQDVSWLVLKQASGYGLPLFCGGLFVWAAANGVRFLIEWQEGVAAVGLVTVGWALGLRASQFAAMLTTAAAFPLAVRKSREAGMAAGQAQLVDNGVLLLAALAPAVSGLYVIAAPLIDVIVAAPYREVTAAVLPAALATGGLRAVRIHFANQVFLLHGEPLVPVLNDGFDAVSTLLLGGLGLWLGGLAGCVHGVMAGAAITLATGLAAARMAHDFTFPLADLCRIGTAAAVMMVAVAGFGARPEAWSLAIAVAIGAVVYGASLAVAYRARAARAIELLSGVLLRDSLHALSPAPLRPSPRETL